MTVGERPVPVEATLRKLSQHGQRRQPITHGWYMRGRRDPATNDWTPEPGLPSDVMVYLDMGDSYVREMYPSKGFFALSDVPTKKATANLNPEFAIMPPKLEVLQMAIGKLMEQRPIAIAALREEIAEINAALKQTGGLMGGEAAQLRRKKAGLEKRIIMIDDDRNFDAMGLYRKCVQERQTVVRSQIPEAQVQALEMEKEVQRWDEHLASLDA